MRIKFLICMLIILAIIPITAYAVGGTFMLSNAGVSGNMVTVTVSVANNPGLAAFNVNLNFDNKKLEPVSLSKGVVLTSGDITSNIQGVTGPDLSVLTHVSALWYNPANITGNGVLFTVQFKIKAGATGETALYLTYNQGDISNQTMEDLAFSTIGTTVIIDNSVPYIIQVESSTLEKQGDVISGNVGIAVTNNTGSPQTGAIIIAIYDNFGKLVGMTIQENEPLANNNSTVNITGINITNATASGYNATVMLWGNASGMKPLSMPKEFKL